MLDNSGIAYPHKIGTVDLNLSKCARLMQDEQLKCLFGKHMFRQLGLRYTIMHSLQQLPAVHTLPHFHNTMAKLESSREGHCHIVLTWYSSSTTAFSAHKKRSQLRFRPCAAHTQVEKKRQRLHMLRPSMPYSTCSWRGTATRSPTPPRKMAAANGL